MLWCGVLARTAKWARLAVVEMRLKRSQRMTSVCVLQTIGCLFAKVVQRRAPLGRRVEPLLEHLPLCLLLDERRTRDRAVHLVLVTLSLELTHDTQYAAKMLEAIAESSSLPRELVDN